MADPTSGGSGAGNGPPGVPSLFNFSDPATTAMLGALQGLGAASAPSRLPVTGGMVFGSLAGGMLAGAKEGAAMRALDTEQIGKAAQTQAGLNSLGFQQALYGQKPSSAGDLLNNRYQTLNMDMPNPGGMQPGPAGAPGSLAPAMPVQSSPLPAPAGTDVGSKIVNAESGGNPTAKNPLSSALGDGQFTDATWLDLIKKQRPDLAMGRSDSQLLALRTDPMLSTEMTQRYAQQNGQILIGAGQQPTPGNLYLAHFLGPAGALNTLHADPGALMASLVSDKAIKANPVLQGKTAGQMIDWANQKMAGAPAPGSQIGSVAPQGAPQQQPSAAASPGGIPNLLANPQTRQLLMMNSAFPGAIPPAAMEYALAQALPPGPMRDLSIAAAQQKAGMPPVQTVRQGGGIMQLGSDGQYHLGAQLPQLSKDQQLVQGPNGLQTQIIPGALNDIRQLGAAEAGGTAGGKLPYVGPTAAAQAAGKAGGELPYEQQLAYQMALGGARLKPEEYPGPYGREYMGPQSLLAGVGATGLQTGMPSFGSLAGGASPGTPAAPSAPPNLVPGGAIPGTVPPNGAALEAGLASVLNRGRSPEAATPTFPVQTPSGPKDISSLSLNDLFPGGQGIPTPPTPPPGMTYGQPSPAEEAISKDDATRIEGYNKEASENQKIYQDLNHLRTIFQSGVTTSKIAPFMADLGNIAQGAGLPDNMIPKSWDPNNLAVVDKASTDVVFALVKKLAGQVRVAEIEGYKRASPSMTLPIPANLNIVNDLLATSKWQDARAKLATDYVSQTGGAPLATFDARYNAMAPLVDVTQAYKNQVRQTPQYQADLQRGIGFPEDVRNPPQHGQLGAPVGATDTRILNGKTYYKIGGQWAQ